MSIGRGEIIHKEDLKIIEKIDDQCQTLYKPDKIYLLDDFYMSMYRERLKEDAVLSYNKTVKIIEKLLTIYDDVKLIDKCIIGFSIIWSQKYYSRKISELYKTDPNHWKPIIIEQLSMMIKELMEVGLIYSNICLSSLMIDEDDQIHLIGLDHVEFYDGRDISDQFQYIASELKITVEEFQETMSYKK